MRPIFSYALIFVSLLAITYLGLDSFGLIQNNVIKDQAAAVAGRGGEDADGTERYVSLMDIVAASLERIKSAQNEVATSSIDHSEEVLDKTTSPPIPEAPSDLADAIVNILCAYQTKDYRRTISGTGFIISKNGAILTNAHVAQFLLLEKNPDVDNITCSARVGNETNDTYTVKLLYISPTWVIKHADIINSKKPRGNGENDFALLYLVEGSDGSGITFPFIPLSTSLLGADMRDRTVILVGYPSTEGLDANEGYSRVIATTTIDNIYTFGSGLADVLSLKESVLGYHGASGGPVIDSLGRAIGVITTKNEGSTMLNAITSSYIDGRMREETGFDLHSTIQGNLPTRATLFNETVSPILGELLRQSLD